MEGYKIGKLKIALPDKPVTQRGDWVLGRSNIPDGILAHINDTFVTDARPSHLTNGESAHDDSTSLCLQRLARNGFPVDELWDYIKTRQSTTSSVEVQCDEQDGPYDRKRADIRTSSPEPVYSFVTNEYVPLGNCISHKAHYI